MNAAEHHPYVDELLRSPVGVLVVARSIVEVGGMPPDMPFANLDRKRQVWIARDGSPPEPASFSADLRPFGGGITKPRRTLWTSTSVGKSPSSWIAYLRWGEDRREPPYHPWRLQVPSSARVYEVHGPQAWQTFCLAYPTPSSLAYSMPTPKGLIEPDWRTVTHDWDGVHLSPGGLLTAERVRWGKPSAQTHLFGWDMESTVWLRWVFDHVERLPDVDPGVDWDNW